MRKIKALFINWLIPTIKEELDFTVTVNRDEAKTYVIFQVWYKETLILNHTQAVGS